MMLNTNTGFSYTRIAGWGIFYGRYRLCGLHLHRLGPLSALTEPLGWLRYATVRSGRGRNELALDGDLLIIRDGYEWDGPSGPSIDTRSFMRGSLVHDALYELLRKGVLHPSARKAADVELRRLCLEDGMHPFRAWYVYWGVRLFGGRHARRQTR